MAPSKKVVKKINPGGPGWKKYKDLDTNQPWAVPNGIIAMFFGCIAVYGFLLGVGQIIYGQIVSGCILMAVGFLATIKLKIRFKL